MDINTKNKILIIAVIFLASLNFATLGSIWYHIKKSKAQVPAEQVVNPDRPPRFRAKPGEGVGQIVHQYPRSTGRVVPRFNRLMEELDLSPRQKQYFLDSRREFLQSHRPMMDSLKYYQALLDSLACTRNPDEKLIKFYSQKIADLHYRFTLDYTLLINDWYKKCTRRQREKFCQIYSYKYYTHPRYRNRRYNTLK